MDLVPLEQSEGGHLIRDNRTMVNAIILTQKTRVFKSILVKIEGVICTMEPI